MQKTILAVGGAILIVASGLSYWAGTRSAPATPAAGPGGAAPKTAAPGIVVEASKVAVVCLPHALTAVGRLRSSDTVGVRPEVAGRAELFLLSERARVGTCAV